jgi:hypothetical protein
MIALGGPLAESRYRKPTPGAMGLAKAEVSETVIPSPIIAYLAHTIVLLGGGAGMR